MCVRVFAYSVMAGVSFGLSVIINPITGLHHTLLNSPLRASLSRSNAHYKIRRLLLFVSGWILEFFTLLFSLSPKIPLQQHPVRLRGFILKTIQRDHKYLNTIIFHHFHRASYISTNRQMAIKLQISVMGRCVDK